MVGRDALGLSRSGKTARMRHSSSAYASIYTWLNFSATCQLPISPVTGKVHRVSLLYQILAPRILAQHHSFCEKRATSLPPHLLLAVSEFLSHFFTLLFLIEFYFLFAFSFLFCGCYSSTRLRRLVVSEFVFHVSPNYMRLLGCTPQISCSYGGLEIASFYAGISVRKSNLRDRTLGVRIRTRHAKCSSLHLCFPNPC